MDSRGSWAARAVRVGESDGFIYIISGGITYHIRCNRLGYVCDYARRNEAGVFFFNRRRWSVSWNLRRWSLAESRGGVSSVPLFGGPADVSIMMAVGGAKDFGMEGSTFGGMFLFDRT